MKILHKLLTQLVAEIALKDKPSFSDQELDTIRACIKQNIFLEDKFFQLKHNIYTLTSEIGRSLKEDPDLHVHFPEYFI